MSLTNRQRWGIYFVGFTAGSVIVAVILVLRGPPKAQDLPQPGIERRLVPGALGQWMQIHQPITGNFVVSEAIMPTSPSGVRERDVVVPGLDPDSFIRIAEYTAPTTNGGEAPVTDWKFMFADRVRAQLNPKTKTSDLADALRAHGWNFMGVQEDANGWVTIALNAHLAASIPEAIKQLQAWPDWILAAEPDYLLPPPQLMNRP